MIDWDSPRWGGNVHESETGSWLPDRHDVPSQRRGALRLASPSDQVATWRDASKGDPS